MAQGLGGSTHPAGVALLVGSQGVVDSKALGPDHARDNHVTPRHDHLGRPKQYQGLGLLQVLH